MIVKIKGHVFQTKKKNQKHGLKYFCPVRMSKT